MPQTSAVSFDVTPAERALISAIAARAAKKGGRKFDTVSCVMDLTACHANGCRLRLQDLLNADDFNFAHDVNGIKWSLDRETGKLTNHFRPRFAEPRRAMVPA